MRDSDARAFYEEEALRGGWSVRELDRQFANEGKADQLKGEAVQAGDVAMAGAARPPPGGTKKLCCVVLIQSGYHEREVPL